MLVMNWIWKENPKHKFSKIHLKRTWKCWKIGRAWYHYDWKLCSELFLAQILAVGDMLLFVVLELSDIGQCPVQRCKQDFLNLSTFLFKLKALQHSEHSTSNENCRDMNREIQLALWHFYSIEVCLHLMQAVCLLESGYWLHKKDWYSPCSCPWITTEINNTRVCRFCLPEPNRNSNSYSCQVSSWCTMVIERA